MIVRNFLQTRQEQVTSHNGIGFVKDALVFGEGDFESNLDFIIYTEISPGSTIGYHPHGEDEEIYVILEGSGIMTVNGEKRSVGPGDIIVNRPGWSHGLENVSEETLKLLVFDVKLKTRQQRKNQN